MRYAGVAIGIVLVASCGKAEKPAAEPAAAAPVPPAATEPVKLADVAGIWRITGYSPAGDSLVAYTINATADTSGWTLTLPGRAPMALRVSVGGDSILTDAGPFESVLRPGVQVTTHAVMRVQGDRIWGTTVARYQTRQSDSVATLRAEGVRQR